MNEEISTLVERLNDVEINEQQEVFEEAVNDLESTELSLLLESLPIDERLQRWRQVPEEARVDVLVNMRSEARQRIIESIPEDVLEDLFSGLDAEDLIYLSDSLPESLILQALQNMDFSQRHLYLESAQFDENQIGRYVDHDMLLFPAATRVKEALAHIRRHCPEYADNVYLVRKNGTFAGIVLLRDILRAEHTTTLKELALENPAVLSAEAALIDACEKIEHSGLASLPVIDINNTLAGRVTLRQALEINREHYESRLMATSGLGEDEDLFAPVLLSSKRRALWLGINLLTAFLASWAIGLFAETLERVVALAVLMPIVASMGGIAGSQTLTLIIRGIAIGQIAKGNIPVLLRKEIAVGLINGVLWAFIVGLIAALWFHQASISLVIAAAIIVNVFAAALSGVVIPVFLNKFNVDPALSGSVILTTVTDIVGFVCFLGLGTWFLL